jgi:hypothetical protein
MAVEIAARTVVADDIFVLTIAVNTAAKSGMTRAEISKLSRLIVNAAARLATGSHPSPSTTRGFAAVREQVFGLTRPAPSRSGG